MTHNDWESGTIKLPSAEFARVRQTIADADMKHKQRLFDLSQDFWKSLTAKEKSDPDAYALAYAVFQKKHDRTVWRNGMWAETVSSLPDGFDQLVQFKNYDYKTKTAITRPKRVLKEDIDFPTNRTVEFDTSGYDGALAFDKKTNTVVWDVSENNHAVDEARGSDMGKAFFAVLKTVKWTRGTGGYIRGNNEYHSDPDNFGGGEHYISAGFGPVGAEEAPHRTDAYWTADGKTVRPEDFPKRVKERAALAKADEKYRKNAAAAIARSKARAAAKAAEGTTSASGVERVQKGVPRKGGQFDFAKNRESTAKPLRN